MSLSDRTLCKTKLQVRETVRIKNLASFVNGIRTAMFGQPKKKYLFFDKRFLLGTLKGNVRNS